MGYAFDSRRALAKPSRAVAAASTWPFNKGTVKVERLRDDNEVAERIDYIRAKFRRNGGPLDKTVEVLEGDFGNILPGTPWGDSSVPVVVSLRSASEWLAITDQGLVWSGHGGRYRLGFGQISALDLPWEGKTSEEADACGRIVVVDTAGRVHEVPCERSGVACNLLCAIIADTRRAWKSGRSAAG